MNENYFTRTKETPEDARERHLRNLRKAVRGEMTKLLDEERSTIARRAALALTNRVVVSSDMQDEINEARACTDNLLDLLFEQMRCDQQEGR